MNKLFKLSRRSSAFAVAVLFAVGVAIPAFLHPASVSAGQISSRSITLSTSQTSAATTTYAVSFNVASTTSILGIVVELCQNSPLIGLSCTTTNGVTSTPTSGTTSVTKTTTGAQTWNVHANSTNTGRYIITNATGFTSVSAGDNISFSFTATNPSALGTFYGRILTYSTTAAAAAYVSATPGSFIDSGGVALSTANQLTVNARVQEQLQFCVGGTTVNDGTTSITTDCSVAFTGSGTCGNTVDLGVVDNSATQISPVTAGNGCNGAAMVRTNAANGVVVSYYPEAGAGTNHTRTLRVASATCTADGIPSTSNTDQCFNTPTGQQTFTAGTEKFGMTVAAINPGSTTSYSCTFAAGTCNMVRDTTYDGTGANTYPTDSGSVGGTTNAGYAWNESATAATIASSASSATKVVDDEAMVLKFAATANITTPTGAYSNVSTYIATATY